jgi:hypothetical protein
MSNAELSVDTLVRLADVSRIPTTEADALCYKFLLQYLAECEVLQRYAALAAKGPVDPEQMWDECNAQKVAVHLALHSKFPQYEYMHMFSFGVDPETNSPCANFVVPESGLITEENSRKMREPNLQRQEAVNNAFQKMFSYYMRVDPDHSFYFGWEPNEEPLNIQQDVNANEVKH